MALEASRVLDENAVKILRVLKLLSERREDKHRSPEAISTSSQVYDIKTCEEKLNELHVMGLAEKELGKYGLGTKGKACLEMLEEMGKPLVRSRFVNDYLMPLLKEHGYLAARDELERVGACKGRYELLTSMGMTVRTQIANAVDSDYHGAEKKYPESLKDFVDAFSGLEI